ncbi:response regulator [Plectonema cf. radiosum LEGE 06105]|uniref:Response regulator n=2 Tax=Plectonema TaxID=1183 RepID=A0A8J7K0K0_9CYAN|nr:response regulator [Plectonema cf. radiosum LEGE 06105]
MKRILVIENKTSTRKFFLKELKAKGFDAIGAKNGQIGIQRVKQELPDLIISEIVMPSLDGYSVLTKLRQMGATAIIPFIFLSEKATQADIRKGMKLGADDYLTKPCTIEELLEAVIAQLEKQAVIKQWYIAQLQPFRELPEAENALGSNVKTQQGSERLPDKAVVDSTALSIFPPVPQLNDIFDFIETHYYQVISLDDVAHSVGYSPAYLTDLVRRKTGQSVYRWITKRRMVAACSLLLETTHSIEYIAEAVGYRHAWCFFRQFRKSFGMTPRDWRSTYHGCVGKTYEDIA